jgi:D-xylose transport system substrate-binding protein
VSTSVGKIPVTGQDATAAGIQQICLGNQSMTVYKPITKIAAAAAHIADVLLRHKGYHSAVRTQTGAGGTPSAIIPVTTATKANIAATVIKDGYVAKSAVPQCHL